MKIFAVDTSSRTLSLGLSDGSKVYEYNLETGRKLSILLAPTIKRVLESLGWQAKDIDYFACGLGPGSFTGLRIGLAAIKGLALALGKPIAAVSTLDILARNAIREEGLVVPLIDAKRNLVYCALYRIKKGRVQRLSAYMLVSALELLERIKKEHRHRKKEEVILLGDALQIYKNDFSWAVPAARILDRDHWQPWGRNIISLAEQKIRKQDFKDAFTLRPVYLYPKECQIRQPKLK